MTLYSCHVVTYVRRNSNACDFANRKITIDLHLSLVSKLVRAENLCLHISPSTVSRTIFGKLLRTPA